jgi:uncharacterized protein (DUF2147 family)
LGPDHGNAPEAYVELQTRRKTVGGKVAATVLLLLGASFGVRAQSADAITGVWQTHGDKPAKIQIYASAGQYYGKIIALLYTPADGKPVVDINNPDAAKRSQPVVGLVLLKAFKFDKDEWNSGQVYDPESGKTYSCVLSLKDANTLKVRGYVGISMFGRTEVWTRSN